MSIIKLQQEGEDMTVEFGGDRQTLIKMVLAAAKRNENLKEVIMEASFFIAMKSMADIINEERRAGQN